MTTYFLDTGILVGYVRGAQYAKYMERRFAVAEPPNIAVVSIVTVGEIYSLSLQLGWGPDKRAALKEILDKIPSVDIRDHSILEKYAEVDAYSQNKHPSLKPPAGVTARNMGKNDVWIAATASVINATLLTTDHDFDHLNGVFLKLEYIDPAVKGGS
ncbi:MAG: type II toxin-antitoxin system VapC family toxin [Chloroflexi bacterium]|nr:type II toxin-antitoxin system VapC family toxin [Chloroflexota bacterium]